MILLILIFDNEFHNPLTQYAFLFLPLQIKDIKDDVEYYIENCREPDFMDNDMLYDDIDGLEEMLLEVNVRGYAVLYLKARVEGHNRFSGHPIPSPD